MKQHRLAIGVLFGALLAALFAVPVWFWYDGYTAEKEAVTLLSELRRRIYQQVPPEWPVSARWSRGPHFDSDCNVFYTRWEENLLAELNARASQAIWRMPDSPRRDELLERHRDLRMVPLELRRGCLEQRIAARRR